MSTATKLIPLASAVLATATVFYVYGVFSLKHTVYKAFAAFLTPYRFFSYS